MLSASLGAGLLDDHLRKANSDLKKLRHGDWGHRGSTQDRR